MDKRITEASRIILDSLMNDTEYPENDYIAYLLDNPLIDYLMKYHLQTEKKKQMIYQKKRYCRACKLFVQYTNFTNHCRGKKHLDFHNRLIADKASNASHTVH